ncbi:MAG TPA: hypothetical protein PKH65_03820 [Bacteroidia bacterium]|nr:hypothetical protein [Bacteroidia bacterium]HNT79787.1 hypothetical protein [Bacteroidia bacterium]
MKILRIVLPVLIILFTVLLIKGIKDPIDYQKEKDFRYKHVIQRLKDIREAQLAYKAENGKFTASFDTLISFVQNGTFTLIKQIGNVDDTSAVIIRDTSFVSIKDSLFKAPDFVVDSLKYVPFGDGAIFDMKAGEIEKGRVKVKVFEVIDTKPFDKNQVLSVGSMSEATNAGNWE